VLQWIAIPASVATLVLVTLGVIHGTVGQSPPVIAAAAVALVVAFGGIGWTVANRSGAQAPEVVALVMMALAEVITRTAVMRLRASRVRAVPVLVVLFVIRRVRPR